MSSNSATGSKFYELIPQQQDYIAARSQSWRPTYSVIHITKDTFQIDTYDAESGSPIDQTYRIIKNESLQQVRAIKPPGIPVGSTGGFQEEHA